MQTQSELMIGVNNAQLPKEGPKTIPVLVDLRTATSVLVDLTQQQMTAKISYIQTVFVDNSLNTASVSITADTTGQILRVPAGTQAYLPILAPIPPRFTIATAGAVIVPIQFLNIPMPFGAIGAGTGGTIYPFLFNGAGALQVADALLDALIANGALSINQGLMRTSPLTRLRINVASAGSTALVAAVAGQTTRVHRLTLSVAAANVVQIRDGATVLETFNFAANGGGVVLDFSQYAWFETTANTALNINLGTAAQVDGVVEYVTGV